MKYTDLTDKQREFFSECFYSLAPYDLIESECAHPWGAPWTWCDDEIPGCTSIHSIATCHWNKYQKEIRQLLSEEAEFEKEY